jgi:2'-5' RNA ligase
MTKERLGSPRARLFVALDLPERIRGALASWQAAELGDPALRPGSAEALHVTLCFLGWTPERRIEEVAAVVTAIERRVVEMRFEPEAVGIPARRPRLLAIEAPSEGAEALAAELSERLQAERLYKPEKRAFWSHVTVARVRSERRQDGSRGRRGGRPMRIAQAPGPLPAEALEAFEVVRITLYRSNLRSQGAEYVPLANLDLTSRPEGGTQKE